MFLFSFCAGAVPVSLLQFCVLVYSFWLRMRNDKCGNQMTMLFNLSRCCKLYSFKKTLKCCFRNWSLRAEDFFFCLQSLKEKKRNKHTRMCLQFTLIWTAPVFTMRFFLFEMCLVLRVLRFSYIFFLCSTMLPFIMKCYLSGLHRSACINLNLAQQKYRIATNAAEHYEKQAVWNKTFCPCCYTWKYSNCTTKVHFSRWFRMQVTLVASRWRCWPAGTSRGSSLTTNASRKPFIW